MANDDPILTTMRFIPQHEVIQKYGANLPDYLITPAMKESEAFKTYYAFATGKATPKPKYVRRTSKDKTEQAPKASTRKRLKVAAKGAKSGKKRQPARGLETLSEVALTKAEQLRIVTKQSLIQTHSSHASGSSAHKGTGVTPGVPDVPTYKYDDEEISWKTSSDDDDDNEGDDAAANDDHDGTDNDSKRTKSDNEGDEFVHLNFTTHDEDRKEEESSDLRVHTPSQSEPSDNKENVDVAQSEYTEEEEVNAEHTYEKEDANDLYRDLNVNLEGRDADMTDAPQTTQVIEDTHVTLTPVNHEGHQQSYSLSSGFISNMLNPNPDTRIDSILNTESTSLVEIPVTFVADTTPTFATTLPPPPLPLLKQRPRVSEWELAKDVYSRRRIIAVTKLQIVERHGYKHLDWITVRRADDKMYSFKEGDFKRLRLQDIEDMLILLVQGKLTNLKVEERLTFSVALQMFIRSIVIQRRVEDLQLGVESYQKKLNITKPDTYRPDLR
ncbi:hypothetical protein Tco_0026940 [Tanacetum coccineum]